MAPNTAAQKKKADERRVRNLQAANVSRQRRREQISSLEQERARLKEANEMLRSRLKIHHGLSSVTPSKPPSGRSSKVDLGPAMKQLSNKREMKDKVAVQLLDRAISGSKGKSTPLDPDLVKKFSEATVGAPTDIKRPYQFLEKGGSSSSHSKSKSSSKGGSSSKSKSSSSKKR